MLGLAISDHRSHFTEIIRTIVPLHAHSVATVERDATAAHR